ncbi:hypothetical protein ACIP2Z_33730 [Streptomyces iakyrus]|uniref:Uncharacterized protein n=1 Tax=Streptomyces iakyrus TaxID=68219 RepID=A0ABW8FP95_9ACTN
MMKFTAIHDRHGNIETLVAGDENSRAPRPELKAGQHCTEIVSADVPDAPDSGMKEKDIFDRLRGMLDNYRVDTEGAAARFVRRS